MRIFRRPFSFPAHFPRYQASVRPLAVAAQKHLSRLPLAPVWWLTPRMWTIGTITSARRLTRSSRNIKTVVLLGALATRAAIPVLTTSPPKPFGLSQKITSLPNKNPTRRGGHFNLSFFFSTVKVRLIGGGRPAVARTVIIGRSPFHGKREGGSRPFLPNQFSQIKNPPTRYLHFGLGFFFD